MQPPRTVQCAGPRKSSRLFRAALPSHPLGRRATQRSGLPGHHVPCHLSVLKSLSLLLFSCTFLEHIAPKIIINIINKERGKLLNVKYAKFLPELTGQFINVMV